MRRGNFSLWISLDPGVNMLHFDFFRWGREMVPMSEMMVVCPEKGADRPFNGSPTSRDATVYSSVAEFGLVFGIGGSAA